MKTVFRAAAVLAVLSIGALAETTPPRQDDDLINIPMPSAGGAWGAIASAAATVLLRAWFMERRRNHADKRRVDEESASVKVAAIEAETELIGTLLRRITEVEARSAARITELETRVTSLEDEKKVDYQKLMDAKLEIEHLKRQKADLEEINRSLENDRAKLIRHLGPEKALAAGVRV
jgi:uncharacterized membrane protein YqiK